MSPTYEVFRRIRPDLGARLFRRASSSRCWSTRCGRRARSNSTKPRACRCGRTDAMARTNTNDHRRRRPASRPPATNGTASRSSTRRCRAGGCGCSTPRSSGRSATGSSIRPGRCLPPTRRACSAGTRASAVVDRPRGAAGAARPDDGASSPAPRSQRDRVDDPQLLDFARALGRRAFADNCAPCHGAGGGGAKGYPNLNDDDWLWGGTLDRHRADHPRTASAPATTTAIRASMPAFGRDGMLKPTEISTVADYVRSLSGLPTDAGRRSRARQESLRRQLRGLPRRRQGKGNRELGAPNLTDKIWLYGRTRRPSCEGSPTAAAASCRPGAAGSTTPPSRRWPSTSTASAAGRSDGCDPGRDIALACRPPSSQPGNRRSPRLATMAARTPLPAGATGPARRRCPALCAARKRSIRRRVQRHLPPHQMGGAGRHARHLLPAAVRALGPRPERARPGGADRSSRAGASISSSSRSGRRRSTTSPAC